MNNGRRTQSPIFYCKRSRNWIRTARRWSLCQCGFCVIDILIALRICSNKHFCNGITPLPHSEGCFYRLSLEKEGDLSNLLRSPLQRNQERNHLKTKHRASSWTRPRRNLKNLKQRRHHHLQKVLRYVHLLCQRRSCLRLPSHRQGLCILKERLPHGGLARFLFISFSLRLWDGGWWISIVWLWCFSMNSSSRFMLGKLWYVRAIWTPLRPMQASFCVSSLRVRRL